MLLTQANALRIPLADESVLSTILWYNAGMTDNTRDNKGRFIEGIHAHPETEFKKGEHWREQKPYWNREWLYNEYVIKQRSSSEIAADFNITDNGILFWLSKLKIPTRNMSETRAVKYWGQRGKDNPMYGKRGEDNPNWKGGGTPERQAFYSSIEWHKAVRVVWRRDKGMCQKCKKQGERRSIDGFHVHHIVSFSNAELRAKPSNLILLCSDCHRWVHSSENIEKEFTREEVTDEFN